VRPTRRLAILAALLLPAAIAVTLALGAPSFAPGSQALGAFDSDSAIPVLMANTARHTAYEAFYWGQDRFGAWPFLLLSLIARAGLVVTPLGLFVFQAIALGVMVLAFGRLAGRAAPLVCGSVLALALVDTQGVRWLWAISQPYAWQLCALALAWQLVRKNVERPTRWRLLGFALLAWLAVWSSLLTLVLLGVVVVTELVMHRGPRAQAGVLLGVALGLATVADTWVHRLHARSTARQGLWFQTTVLQLDLQNLGRNLAHVLGALTHSLGGVLVLLALGLAVLALVRRRSDPGLRALGLGATACAAATVAIFSVTSWMRLNADDPRYLTPAFVLAAVAVPALLTRFVPSILRVAWPLALVLLVLGVWRAPPALPAAGQAGRKAAADALAARAPLVLYGSYWELYALAGLRPDAAITPANIASEFDRMSFTRGALHAAPEVVVALDATERFGPATAPVPFIAEDKILLELQDGAGFEAGGHHFARYRARTAQMLEVVMEVPAQAAVDRRNDPLWVAEPLAQVGGSFSARVHAPEHARVVLVLGEINERPLLPRLQLVPLDATGARCGEVRALQGSVNVLIAELIGCREIAGVQVESLQQQGAPRIRELAVVTP
jgi:hypothetical protein